MKYYDTNFLIVEFPTKFAYMLGVKNEEFVKGREKWKVAFTSLNHDKIRIIPRGSKLPSRRGEKLGQKTKKRLILVDAYATREEFMEAISKFFSETKKCKPSELNFQFEKPENPFGDLNEP